MERVVLTGMGAVTPLGNSVPAYWDGLKNGVNGIKTITSFDTTGYKAKVAGEIRDFDPLTFLDKKEASHMDRNCQFALAAAKEANANALSDSTSQIAVAGAQRKDQIEGQYRERKQQLDETLRNLEGQKQNIFDMASNAVGGAVNGYANGMGLG